MPPIATTPYSSPARHAVATVRKLFLLGLCLYWPLLATATHWPRLQLPLSAPDGDKLLHYVSFGLLALLAYFVLAPRRHRLFRVIVTAAVTIAYAAVDEWTQRWFAGRVVSFNDFLANVTGVALVLSGVLVWPRERQPTLAGIVAGLARFLLIMTLPLLIWATVSPSGTVRQVYRAVHLPYVLHLFGHGFTQDKQAHVLVMLPLTWLLLLARPLGARRFWSGAAASLAVLLASAPGVEWLQRMTGSGRDWEWADMIFHEIGVGLGLVTFALVAVPLWLAWKKRSHRPTPGDESFVGHAKLISALTLVSRVLGMLRESVMAAYLGATLITDAFYFAFTVPNLFRKLFGEGALSAAFIPLYTQSLKSDGPEKANRFAAASVSLLTLILLALTVAGELLLWGLAYVVRPEQLLLIKLTAIMLPYVLLICGTAFLSGILQAHHRFGLPAATPFVLNIVHIAVIVIGAGILGLNGQDAPERLALQTTLIYWLAFFVLIAGGLQVLMLVPALHASGFHFRFRGARIWTPTVKRMLQLSVPVALSAGVLQFSVLIDKTIPAFLAATDGVTHFTLLGYAIPYPVEAGAVARLNWAQFLYQFPLGVFAIAIATAIFPSLSADAFDTDRQRFRFAIQRGILVTLLEGFSASIGLIIVAYPAVRVLFHVDTHSTDLIVRSTILYSTAIAAYSLQQIINRAYYSLHDMTTPFVMSIITLVVNTVVEIPLLWTPLAESGMAAGTAVSFSIQAVVMLVMLDRKVGGLDLPRIALEALKMVVAALVMGLACTGIQHLPFYPQGDTRWTAAAQLLLLIPFGAAVYLVACALLRTRALSTFLSGGR